MAKIKVTQVHIDKALQEKYPCSGGCCPVFQAFSDYFQTQDVYAAYRTVRVKAVYFKLSEAFTEQVEKFLTTSQNFEPGEYEYEYRI